VKQGMPMAGGEGRQEGEAEVGALSPEEALPLLRRAAGARGLDWPDDPRQVSGVGGFRLKATSRPGRQTLVWATLFKNGGLLALFDEGQLLAAPNGSLARVLRVQPVALPELPYLAILVDDLYDEWTGALLREERRRLYAWDGRGLRELFRGVLASEQVVHDRWLQPKGLAVWRRAERSGQVGLEEGNLIYTLREVQSEAAGEPTAPIPAAERFRLTADRAQEQRYRFNPRLLRFEPVTSGGRAFA
jgi:hypothetical protein